MAGGRRPERPKGKFRGLRGKLKVPHRQRDWNGRGALIGGDGNGPRISSRRAVRRSAGHGNVDPVWLILPRADGRIAGLEGGRCSAQGRTGFRIVEGDERFRVAARTQWRIATAAVIRGGGDGDVVLS